MCIGDAFALKQPCFHKILFYNKKATNIEVERQLIS